MAKRTGFRCLAALVLLSWITLAQGVAPGHEPGHVTKDYGPCAKLMNLVTNRPWPYPQTEYSAARCLAIDGQKDDALLVLQLAVDHPAFREYDEMIAEPAFVSLHEDPAWPGLMSVAEKKRDQLPATAAGVDPRSMQRHRLKYPATAKRYGEPRTTTLVVYVAPDGALGTVSIETSSGDPTLDQAAIDFVKKWDYLAGDSNGVKFGGAVRIPITFK